MQSLPYLARVPPGLAISEGGAITLPKEELMSAANYPWCAEGSRSLRSHPARSMYGGAARAALPSCKPGLRGNKH